MTAPMISCQSASADWVAWTSGELRARKCAGVVQGDSFLGDWPVHRRSGFSWSAQPGGVAIASKGNFNYVTAHATFKAPCGSTNQAPSSRVVRQRTRNSVRKLQRELLEGEAGSAPHQVQGARCQGARSPRSQRST